MYVEEIVSVVKKKNWVWEFLFQFSSIKIFRRVFRKQREGLRTCCFGLTSVFGRQREGCRVSCFGLKLGDYRRCSSTAEIERSIDLSGG